MNLHQTQEVLGLVPVEVIKPILQLYYLLCLWLFVQQFPMSFGVELQRGLRNAVLKKLLDEAEKSCLWEALTAAHA